MQKMDVEVDGIEQRFTSGIKRYNPSQENKPKKQEIFKVAHCDGQGCFTRPEMESNIREATRGNKLLRN